MTAASSRANLPSLAGSGRTAVMLDWILDSLIDAGFLPACWRFFRLLLHSLVDLGINFGRSFDRAGAAASAPLATSSTNPFTKLREVCASCVRAHPRIRQTIKLFHHPVFLCWSHQSLASQRMLHRLHVQQREINEGRCHQSPQQISAAHRLHVQWQGAVSPPFFVRFFVFSPSGSLSISPGRARCTPRASFGRGARVQETGRDSLALNPTEHRPYKLWLRRMIATAWR